MSNLEPMGVAQLLDKIRHTPEQIAFAEVISAIDANYHYTPTRFTNGPTGDQVINEVGSNEGSCKIFAFAMLNQLNREQTLACFGNYYREDVLQHPHATDHANIRTFIRHGWEHLQFDAPALTL